MPRGNSLVSPWWGCSGGFQRISEQSRRIAVEKQARFPKVKTPERDWISENSVS